METESSPTEDLSTLIAKQIQPLQIQIQQLSESIQMIPTMGNHQIPENNTWATKLTQTNTMKKKSPENINLLPTLNTPPSISPASYLIFQNINLGQSVTKHTFALFVNSKLYLQGLFPRISPDHIQSIAPYTHVPSRKTTVHFVLLDIEGLAVCTDQWFCRKHFLKKFEQSQSTKNGARDP